MISFQEIWIMKPRSFNMLKKGNKNRIQPPLVTLGIGNYYDKF